MFLHFSIKARRRIARINRRVHILCGLPSIVFLIALIAALWVVEPSISRYLEENRNADPDGIQLREKPPVDMAMAYDLILPDGQVIRVDNSVAEFLADAPQDQKSREERRLYKNFAEAIKAARGEGTDVLPSISLIHWRLKRENDRLLMDIQRAAFKETCILLDELDAELSGGDGVEGRAFVAAARSLAGGDNLQDLPDAVRKRAHDLIAEFNSGRRSRDRLYDESQVAPRYTTTPGDEILFRTNRFLLGQMTPRATEEILDVLEKRGDLRNRLDSIAGMILVFENAAATDHLAARLDQDTPSAAGACFLPSAQTPELRLLQEMHGGVPLSDDHDWMGDVVDAIRSCRLDTTPRIDSGWYDRQIHAIAPLVNTHDSLVISTGKFRAAPGYRNFMEDTFRAAMTGDRETHLLLVRLASLVGDIPMYRGEIHWRPRFSCEPEPAVYWRLQESYEWLGHRLGDGPMGARARELSELCRSLAAITFLETGINPRHFGKPIPSGYPHDYQEPGGRWLKGLLDDEELQSDPRVCYDVESGHQWAIVGVRLQRLHYDFERTPLIEGMDVLPEPAEYLAPVLVAAELPGAIPHDEFLRLCDQSDGVEECLAALRAVMPGEEEQRISFRTILAGFTLLLLLFLARQVRRQVQRLSERIPRHRRFLGCGLRLRRPRIAFRPVLALGIFSLIVLSPVILAWCSLHVLPRLDIPRHWVAEMSLPMGIPKTDYSLVPGALRSDSPSVRHNVEGLIESVHYVAVTPKVEKALIEIIETRDRAEATVAMRLLLDRSMKDTDQNGLLSEVKRLLAIWDYDPDMVIYTTGLAGVNGDEEILRALEKAIPKAERNSIWFAASVAADLYQHRHIPPYDRMVQLGLFPSDPKDASSFRDPGEWALLGFSAHVIQSDPTEARIIYEDERIVDYMLEYSRMGREYALRTGHFLNMLGYNMPPEYCPRYAEKFSDWIITAPEITSDPSGYVAVLKSCGSKMWHERASTCWRDCMERIYQSGRWNDYPNPDYYIDYYVQPNGKPTMGEWMEDLLTRNAQERERLKALESNESPGADMWGIIMDAHPDMLEQAPLPEGNSGAAE